MVINLLILVRNIAHSVVDFIFFPWIFEHIFWLLIARAVFIFVNRWLCLFNFFSKLFCVFFSWFLYLYLLFRHRHFDLALNFEHFILFFEPILFVLCQISILRMLSCCLQIFVTYNRQLHSDSFLIVFIDKIWYGFNKLWSWFPSGIFNPVIFPLDQVEELIAHDLFAYNIFNDVEVWFKFWLHFESL